MTKPLKVGITGGIGSGKTIVTKLFSLLDIPIYYSDERAKVVMNDILKEPIIEAFGEKSFSNGVLNREYLASNVFKDEAQLSKLNAIVHPAVAFDFSKWLTLHSEDEYVVKEAALLVETGSFTELDVLIVVISPLKLRIERIRKRDGFRTEEEIKRIISKQTDDETKISFADFVITNNEDQLLIPQVIEIDKKIRQCL